MDKTLRNFKKHIHVDRDDNPADILNVIIARSEQVRKTQSAVVEDRMKHNLRLAGYNVPPTPVVNAVTPANEEEDDSSQEIHFQYPITTNDIESGSPNYGSMTEKTSLI